MERLTSREKLLNVLREVQADVQRGIRIKSLSSYSKKHKCTTFSKQYITGIADKTDEELQAIVEQIKTAESQYGMVYRGQKADSADLFNQPKEMTDKEMVEKLRENGWDVTCTRSL